MRTLAVNRDGWVNIKPLVDEDKLPDRPGGFGIFSGGLPALPIGTWMPPEERRGKLRPGSIGLQHPVSRKVASRLVGAGVIAPPEWKGVQDNARRGVVIEVPETAEAEQILDWILGAIIELSPIELEDLFAADIHMR